MSSLPVKYTCISSNQEKRSAPAQSTDLANRHGMTNDHHGSPPSNKWVTENYSSHQYRHSLLSGERPKPKGQRAGSNKSLEAKYAHRNVQRVNIERKRSADLHLPDLSEVQPLDLSVRKPGSVKHPHYGSDDDDVRNYISPIVIEPVDLPVDLSMKTQEPQAELLSRTMLAEMPPTNVHGQVCSRSGILPHGKRRLKVPTILPPSVFKKRRKTTKPSSPTGYKLAILVDENGDEIYRMGQGQNHNECSNNPVNINRTDSIKLDGAPKMFKSLLTGALLNQNEIKNSPLMSDICHNPSESILSEKPGSASDIKLSSGQVSILPFTSTDRTDQNAPKTVPLDIKPDTCTSDIKDIKVILDEDLSNMSDGKKRCHIESDVNINTVIPKKENPCDSSVASDLDDSSDRTITPKDSCLNTSKAYRLVELATSSDINFQKGLTYSQVPGINEPNLPNGQGDVAKTMSGKKTSPKSSPEMQHVLMNDSGCCDKQSGQETVLPAKLKVENTEMDIQLGPGGPHKSPSISESNSCDIPSETSSDKHSNSKGAKINTKDPTLQKHNGSINNIERDLHLDDCKNSGNMSSKLYSLLTGLRSKNDSAERNEITAKTTSPLFCMNEDSFSVSSNENGKNVSMGSEACSTLSVEGNKHMGTGKSLDQVNGVHVSQTKTCLRSLLSGKLVFQDKQDIQEEVVVITKGTNRSNKSIDVVVDYNLGQHNHFKPLSSSLLQNKPRTNSVPKPKVTKPKKVNKLEQICQSLWQKNANRGTDH